MKCIVGMSGGVDSSVCVALLKEKYDEILGCTFKMFDSPKVDEAISDAQKVAEYLKIPHVVIDCSEDFKKYVTDYFVEAYQIGSTPNPCVVCNKFVKFHWLEKVRQRYNADKIATGHYAKILKQNDCVELHQAKDLSKDQSYFLYQLSQEVLQHTELPLGNFSKEEIRAIAEKIGIHVAKKSDSQDVCFIPNGNYVEFVKTKIGQPEPGEIVLDSGEVLGNHNGTINFTIGQRKGLGLSGGPFFVKEIKPAEKKVVVSDKDGVKSDCINLATVHFINEPFEGQCEIKIRSSNKKLPAIVSNRANQIMVHLLANEYGAAKGQHCVFYLGSQVLGGGVIC